MKRTLQRLLMAPEKGTLSGRNNVRAIRVSQFFIVPTVFKYLSVTTAKFCGAADDVLNE